MKFVSLALRLLALPVAAYEGQPMKIALLTGPAQMQEVELPEISAAALKAPKEACDEDYCFKALEFQEVPTIMVGDIMYETHRFLFRVDSEGRMILDEEAPATLTLRESLTRTSLSLNRRNISCFGSSSKGICTNYAVTEPLLIIKGWASARGPCLLTDSLAIVSLAELTLHIFSHNLYRAPAS
jgi:hypothetical protein